MGLRPRSHRCHPLLLPTPRERKADHREEAQRPPGAGRLRLRGKEAARAPCQLHSHPSLLGTGWGRELTAAGPGQIPGAADVHEGARRPIRPAGIVIKGPVAEQAWCSGTMASESQPGWGTSPQVPHRGGCPAETCARLTSTEASYPPSTFPPSRCHLSAVGLAAKYLRSLFSHLENGVDPQPTGLCGDK